MKRVIHCIACFTAILTLAGCESRKDEFVRVLNEAKQFENELEGAGPHPSKTELSDLIEMIEEDEPDRWRVSSSTGRILETIESYLDYRNPSKGSKCFYVITDVSVPCSTR